MPLFGKRQEENEKLRAEIDRLEALPLAELAAELMTKGFGPGSRPATATTRSSARSPAR